MKKTVNDVIGEMKEFDADKFADDYSKVMVKGFVSDLESSTEISDKRTYLLDLLDEFKHTNFCNKNFSDCLDCYNHKECDAIRAVMELVSNSSQKNQQK